MRYHPKTGETLFENIGLGDDVVKQFCGQLGYTPIAPGSLCIQVGASIIESDKFGNLSICATNVGWVSQITGVFSLMLPQAPAANTPLRASYRYIPTKSNLYYVETDDQGRIILTPTQVN